MALAPFFDKTALAAAAVLQGFDRERFAATLDAQVVALAYDDAAAQSSEGRVALAMGVNLLSRLYPTLTLLSLGIHAEQQRAGLEELARAINPDIALATLKTADDGRAVVALVVGASGAAAFGLSADTTTIYIGSNGWDARVSTDGPVGSALTGLPFGAAAAACLGAANVFRHVFAEHLPHPALDRALTLSTLTLRTDLMVHPAASTLPSAADPGRLESGFDIGAHVLVGAGAVGQACLWTLARVRGLAGAVDVVDGEAVDASNPQRYVLATSADEGLSKVALAAALMDPTQDPAPAAIGEGGLAERAVLTGRTVRHVDPSQRATLTVVPHPVRWGAFLASRPTPWRLPRVLVALDSARDRIAVQAALPQSIANAWTQPGDLGISRHAGFGDAACLACLYLPTSANPVNEDVLVADAVGLTGQHMLVRGLLATGAPVDENVLRQMAAGLGVPVEPLLAFRGRPLRAFYSEAVCGGVVLRLQSSQRDQDPQQELEGVRTAGGRPQDHAAMVPMAFQSAMAGVLLAATAVAAAADLPSPPPGQKAVIDLLRPLAPRTLVPLARHPSGKCLCHDADYRAAYRRQWGEANVGGVSEHGAAHPDGPDMGQGAPVAAVGAHPVQPEHR